jgi:hypothetical protein
VLKLPNSQDQELTLDNVVEIRKQSTPEEAEEPEPGPEDRTVTVSESTEGLGFTDVGIRVFEGIDSYEQRKVDNESRGCLLDGSEGEEAVFVYLCRPDYVAGLGTTGDATSVYNCTMKIFTSQNFGFPVALHLQIFKEAMLAFNLQIRRKCEDMRFCSVTNTHAERECRCILLRDTHERKVKPDAELYLNTSGGMVRAGDCISLAVKEVRFQGLCSRLEKE